MAAPNRTYVSNGQVLEQPPLTARISRSIDNVYNFFGLYLVSLLSLDPYTSAQNSQFNTTRASNSYTNRPRWAASNNSSTTSSSSSSGPGTGLGNNSNNNPPKRAMGTVDDVRGPECGSCQG